MISVVLSLLFKKVDEIHLREFVQLPSSWPPAREVGGSEPQWMTPFPPDPVDPGDPGDPGMCSESGLASRRNATFRKKVACRRDETLVFDFATSKVGLPSRRNTSFPKNIKDHLWLTIDPEGS